MLKTLRKIAGVAFLTAFCCVGTVEFALAQANVRCNNGTNTDPQCQGKAAGSPCTITGTITQNNGSCNRQGAKGNDCSCQCSSQIPSCS
ncbi:hypothetical protein MCBRY_003039 [Methylocystis bryophila]